MRSKFIIVLFVLALLVWGGVFFRKQYLRKDVPTSATIPAPADASANGGRTSAFPPVPAAPAAASALTPEQRQEAVDTELDRLQDWSLKDDPASLSNILADLGSPEKEIREAAIEAAKQFGSTNAIPALKAAVNRTDDTREKIDLLEAVDFLSLPGIDPGGPAHPKTPEQIQAIQQEAARKRALRKAQMQNQPAGRDSSSPPGQSPSSSGNP